MNNSSSPADANSARPTISSTVQGSDGDANALDNRDSQLDKLLAAADWKAVDEAKRIGLGALPVIRKYVRNSNFQIRQIAVSAAGATEVPQAADIMSAGLRDENINVRIAAGRELSLRPYPDATDVILDILANGSDDILREFLATASGYLPSQKTVAVLRPLIGNDSVLSDKAVYALARLRDPAGRKVFSAKLSSPVAGKRYEALENLCYVNDTSFIPAAKKLLSDKAVGLTIGSARNPRNRKVADEAVDALVCLLKLKPPFATSPESIYIDSQIMTVRNLVK